MKTGFISGTRNNLPAEENLHYCEIQFIWNIILVISLVMSVFISKFQWRTANRAAEILPLLWIIVWYITLYFVPLHRFELDIVYENINDWLTQKWSSRMYHIEGTLNGVVWIAQIFNPTWFVIFYCNHNSTAELYFIARLYRQCYRHLASLHAEQFTWWWAAQCCHC